MKLRWTGAAIRDRRIERGMPLAELARRVPIARETMHKIEQGYSHTTPAVLLRLCELLEMDATWIRELDLRDRTRLVVEKHQKDWGSL